jgi:hypothetical protein
MLTIECNTGLFRSQAGPASAARQFQVTRAAKSSPKELFVKIYGSLESAFAAGGASLGHPSDIPYISQSKGGRCKTLHGASGWRNMAQLPAFAHYTAVNLDKQCAQ